MSENIKKTGFTLMELMVVITIIGLLGAMILPTVLGMFNANSDAQAYAVLTAQLASARSLAMKSSAYTCVHIQQAATTIIDPHVQPSSPTISGQNQGKFFSAILVSNSFTYYDYTSGTRPIDSKFYPDQVFAVGKITSVSSNSITADNLLADYTTSDNVRHYWLPNQWAGYWVRILTGAATGQTRQITANTVGLLTIASAFDVSPGAGDYYMIYRPTGIDPVVLPGTIAFGNLTSPFVSGSNFVATAVGDTTAPIDPNDTTNLNVRLGQAFNTVTILFSPSGDVVTAMPGGGPPTFATIIPGASSSTLTVPGATSGSTVTIYAPNLPGYFWEDINHPDYKTQLWWATNLALAVPQPYGFGTPGVTILDYTKFSTLNGPNRATYLNNDCPFLPINVYTGQLLPRK